jgi:hypothetical protein
MTSLICVAHGLGQDFYPCSCTNGMDACMPPSITINNGQWAVPFLYLQGQCRGLVPCPSDINRSKIGRFSIQHRCTFSSFNPTYVKNWGGFCNKTLCVDSYFAPK